MYLTTVNACCAESVNAALCACLCKYTQSSIVKYGPSVLIHEIAPASTTTARVLHGTTSSELEDQIGIDYVRLSNSAAAFTPPSFAEAVLRHSLQGRLLTLSLTLSS